MLWHFELAGNYVCPPSLSHESLEVLRPPLIDFHPSLMLAGIAESIKSG
jgi:hypothetical protein